MPYKPCNRCGKDIGFRKEGDKTVAINPDGSPHRCKAESAGNPAAPIVCTARLDAFTSGSATFRVKSGRSKTYAILGSMATEWKTAGWKQGTWLEFTLDARNFVQGPKEVPEPAWGKDLEAQQEIAPAQPAQKPAAAAGPQQETRTQPQDNSPAYDASKIDKITIGGTINLLNYENVRIEVTGTDPEEIRKCLAHTALTLGGGHEPTKQLITDYIKRVLTPGGGKR